MVSSISIIIPTYNRAELIVRSVESGLAAMSPEDELIVIDDGSTDNTAEVLQPYRDRIRYVRNEIVEDEQNRNLGSGAGRARNLGIKLAKSPLVAFLDSDDEWMPEKLYLQRKVMESFPKVVFSFSNLFARRPDGEIVHDILDIWRKDSAVGYIKVKECLNKILTPGIPFSSIASLPLGVDDFNVYVGHIYNTLMDVYWVWTCAIMVRKEVAGKAFRFAEDRHIFEDWECFARMAKLGPAAYLDRELAIQNIHPGIRNTDVGPLQQATDRINLLHRIWGADESFMKGNSSRFRDVLHRQHLLRAKYLIKQGRMKEAKEDLKLLGGGPWSYRLLMRLPSSLIKALLNIRHRFMWLK